MHELEAQIEAMKACWMTGGSALSASPQTWRDQLGDHPELALLALAGQFTRIATRPALGKTSKRALLPKLALSPLPEETRPLFRRLVEAKGTGESHLIRLITARGYTVNPADWMPKPNATDLPEVYSPWLDWLADEVHGVENDVLTAENWEDWSPHARLAEVTALRVRDPDAARMLIESVAPTLAAEPRLRLISVLSSGLCLADEPFLVSLETDRSAKVKTLAHGLLARLGKARANAEAQEELAAFFELNRAGIISRKKVVGATKIKTNAQRNRRAELSTMLPLSALAEGLGLTTREVVDLWDFGDATDEIITMTASTGTDEDALALFARTLDQADHIPDIESLIARLPVADRLAFAPRAVAKDDAMFEVTASLLEPALGALPLKPITSSTAFSKLCAVLKKDDHMATRISETGFVNLGLIADQAAAEALLTHFTTKSGLMAADPRLALLRLNASLKETAP